MRHDYSLAHLTVLSLTPPQVVEVAGRAGYRYVGLRLTRVTEDEPLYDLAHDRALKKVLFDSVRAALDGIGQPVSAPSAPAAVRPRSRPRRTRSMPSSLSATTFPSFGLRARRTSLMWIASGARA